MIEKYLFEADFEKVAIPGLRVDSRTERVEAHSIIMASVYATKMIQEGEKVVSVRIIGVIYNPNIPQQMY